ncbi:hypothetical protein FRC08_012127 [Ceratobasidium sp. 394]|nr:hypothetical protein FRC08_012127 [Ceratobasidium sp. 394]
MPPIEYRPAFSSVVQLPRWDHVLASLSPDGRYLAYCNNETLSLLDTRTGLVVGIVKFQSDNCVTSIIWINESILFMGKSCGSIQVGALVLEDNDMSDSRVMELSTIIQETCHAIISLAYDSVTGLFAFADRKGNLLVFRLHLERSHSKKWRLIDQRTTFTTGGQVSDMRFFGNTRNKQLFIGLDNGAMIWTGVRQPFKQLDLDDFSVSNCTISEDGAMMAVATRDLRIIVWPLLASGPDLKDPRVFTIPADLAHSSFTPGAAISFVKGRYLLIAYPLGGVCLLSEDGEPDWIATFANLRVKSIICYDKWVYLTTLDPVNAVHVNAFTSDLTAIQKFDASANNWKSAVDKQPLIQEYACRPTLLVPEARRQSLKFLGFTLYLVAMVAMAVLLHTVLCARNESLYSMPFGIEGVRSHYQTYLRKLMS